MKNKVSESGDSIFKKKGFFIALYSCLGAVMVLALVISFTNLTTGPGSQEQAQQQESQSNSVNVNTNTYESYLAKAQAEAQAQAEADEQAWRKPTPKPTVTPKATAAPRATARPTVPVTTAPPATATPEATAAPTATEAPATTGSAPVDPADTQEVSAEAEASQETAFTPFSEDDKMIWPVYGDIAMVFSMDKLVYDPTLDQYRTNDDLRIAAQEGTPVKAGADGKVVEVDNSDIYGNFVAVDHGNGLVATYGQLMDGVLVAEGDIVKAGQVIGGVGKPSCYGSLNGTHVNLRITKENEPVDPKTLLADGQ